MVFLSFVLLGVFIAPLCQSDATLRPRGVALTKLSFYRPGDSFQCLDKSQTFSFSFINDNYCDCPDGSDEPGTSACHNGQFYCANAGYRSKLIPSMFVDDGVCDCCDGSDESTSAKSCPNSCEELSKVARHDAEQKRAAAAAGHTIYQEYVKKYTNDIGAKRERLQAIEPERKAAEEVKNAAEQTKIEAEKPESEAKEAHRKAWEDTKLAAASEAAKTKATTVFDELNINKDGFLSLTEIQLRPEFDVDGNGEVSIEEAREHLEDVEQSNLSHFTEKVWPNIKDIYNKKPISTASPAEPEAETEDLPPEEDEDAELGEDHRNNYLSTTSTSSTEDTAIEELKEPEYSEETRRLIDTATQARNAFDLAKASFEALDREYNDLVAVTSTDFGPSGEFYALRGQCFELNEREYTYRLCPFDKAAQKQKSGHETNLGGFEGWGLNEATKYFTQRYTGGESCWNGPARSVTVKIICAGENKVLSTSEPSRCEYAMDFTTPAACNKAPTPVDDPSWWSDATHHEDL